MFIFPNKKKLLFYFTENGLFLLCPHKGRIRGAVSRDATGCHGIYTDKGMLHWWTHNCII
jgi:hypothetical protein